MKKKLVKSGGSLAVTQTGAVTVRPGVRYIESGKLTRRFAKLAKELLDRRANVYRALAR